MLAYLILYWRYRREYKTLDSLDRLVQGNRFVLLPFAFFAAGYLAFLVTLFVVLFAFAR
jgi:hypothetical protein